MGEVDSGSRARGSRARGFDASERSRGRGVSDPGSDRLRDAAASSILRESPRSSRAPSPESRVPDPFTSSSASCSTAIIPRPSRSTLTSPMSAQSSLSHWTTTRSGMLAFSSGTTSSRRPWQITMPPECWPRWRGRSWIRCHSWPNSCIVGVVHVDADLAQVALERVLRIDPLEVVHHLRQPIDLRRLERQRLAHFARGAAAAIGDHVGGHGDPRPGAAVGAVLLVHVLDHPLAAIAARQIEIDVRPLAALLREEPLEQQIHADRIDRGDPEAVADGAVGGRAAPLHEDVVLPAVIDDVPDDQEVAGEIELLDQIELALDLPRGRDRRTAGSARARRPA